jgi:hypothetical protein
VSEEVRHSALWWATSLPLRSSQVEEVDGVTTKQCSDPYLTVTAYDYRTPSEENADYGFSVASCGLLLPILIYDMAFLPRKASSPALMYPHGQGMGQLTHFELLKYLAAEMRLRLAEMSVVSSQPLLVIRSS